MRAQKVRFEPRRRPERARGVVFASLPPLKRHVIMQFPAGGCALRAYLRLLSFGSYRAGVLEWLSPQKSFRDRHPCTSGAPMRMKMVDIAIGIGVAVAIVVDHFIGVSTSIPIPIPTPTF